MKEGAKRRRLVSKESSRWRLVKEEEREGKRRGTKGGETSSRWDESRKAHLNWIEVDS